MEWHDTGIAASAGGWHRCDVAATPILVAAVAESWVAVADLCSHARCAFSEDGEIDGEVVICNCHGSEFDLHSGAVLVGPATKPIGTFPVRVRNDRVEVAT